MVARAMRTLFAWACALALVSGMAASVSARFPMGVLASMLGVFWRVLGVLAGMLVASWPQGRFLKL